MSENALAMSVQAGEIRRRVLVLALSLVVALGFGLSFGDQASNHPTYVTPGLRLLDPDLLSRDWWATQTTHYHLLFPYLVAGLARVGALEAGLAAGNVVGALIFCWVSYLALRRWTGDGFWPWLALMGMFALAYGTNSVAVTYLFSPSLQPSTVSTAAYVAAIHAFLRGRLGLAGAALAVAGAFHANFLLLAFPAFGGALLLESPRRLPIRAALLLGPAFLVLLAQLPAILDIALAEATPAERAIATRAFIDMAVPGHYKPMTFLHDFAPLAGWCLVASPWLAQIPAEMEEGRRLRGLFVATAALIAVATALTTVVFVEPVSRLFVWRLAPFVLWLAVAAAAAMAANVLARGYGDRRFPKNPWRLAVSGLGMLAVLRHFAYWEPLDSPIFLIHVAFFGFVALAWAFKAYPALAARVGFPPPRRGRGADGRWAAAVAVWAVAAAGFGAVRAIETREARHFNLVRASYAEPSEQALFDWARTRTDRDSVFLIPPRLIGFRLQAERAVVVEFWAPPMKAREIAQWFGRLEDISGVYGVADKDAIERGYANADWNRLRRLADRYGARYAVFRKPPPALGASYVYRNAGFVVYDLAAGP